MAVLKRQLADGTYELVEFYGKFVRLEETFTAQTDNVSIIQIQNSYSKVPDILSVYFEGVRLVENENYTISPDSRNIILTDWFINTGEKVYIEIFKNAVNVDNLTSGSQIEDLSIDKHKLSQVLQDEITGGGNAVKTVNGEIPDDTGNVDVDFTDVNNSISSTDEKVNTHILDTDSHISKEEKDRWNAIVKTESIEAVLNRGENVINAEHESMVDIIGLEGKTIVNHVSLFDSGLWFRHDDSYTMNSPSKVTLIADVDYRSRGIYLNLKPNAKYVLSAIITGDGARIGVRTGHSIDGSAIATFIDNPVSFISPNDGLVTIRLDNGVVYPTICTFENIMLNEGDVALPFVANVKGITNPTIENKTNGTNVTAKTTLYEGDKLFSENGQLKVFRKKKEIVLDGSLDWIFDGRFKEGSKQVYIKVPQLLNVKHAVKYSGSLIHNYNYNGGWDGDLVASGNNGSFNFLEIGIFDEDSGWGENYTPTPDEIKAYFLGWRMHRDSFGNPYDGVGEKYWAKTYCGVGFKEENYGTNGVVGGSGVKTLPTVINDMGYTPYRLIYELEEPIEEVVKTVGNLTLNKGVNNIAVSEGRVVREFIKPFLGGEKRYNINNGTGGYEQSLLKFKVDSFINIYKNGKSDIAQWTIYPNTITTAGALAQINIANFDQTAVYEVDYIPLEPYKVSSPANPITIEYQSNLGSVVSELIEDTSDIKSRTSDIERTMIRKDEGLQWINATVLHATKGTIKYAKDSSGYVSIYIRMNDLIWNDGVIIGKLPAGFRPKEIVYMAGGLGNIHPYNGVIPFTIRQSGNVVLGHGMPISGQTLIEASIDAYAIFKAEL